VALTPEQRDAQLVLAASRAVFIALTVPALPLADAAKRFGYQARTPAGDAFENAFLWAHEEVEFAERAREEKPSTRRIVSSPAGENECDLQGCGEPAVGPGRPILGPRSPRPSLCKKHLEEDAHHPACDLLDVDPAIGRATKPCNCRARLGGVS
jgi:hypothetical protein